MRTTISESTNTTSGPVPRRFRPRTAGAACDGIGNTPPRGTHPRSAVVRYGHARVRPSRASHPAVRVERARLRLATLALAALLSAMVVCGLLGLAQLRTGGAAAAQTTVVRVHDGESLTEVAARVRPGRPVSQTVRRIAELNALPSAQAVSRQTLIVPAQGR